MKKTKRFPQSTAERIILITNKIVVYYNIFVVVVEVNCFLVVQKLLLIYMPIPTFNNFENFDSIYYVKTVDYHNYFTCAVKGEHSPLMYIAK